MGWGEEREETQAGAGKAGVKRKPILWKHLYAVLAFGLLWASDVWAQERRRAHFFAIVINALVGFGLDYRTAMHTGADLEDCSEASAGSKCSQRAFPGSVSRAASFPSFSNGQQLLFPLWFLTWAFLRAPG